MPATQGRSQAMRAHKTPSKRHDRSSTPYTFKPKKSRTLNSWLAFRSFYSPIFTGQEQKGISTYLTHMWAQDPCKDKWAILAKAYSKIKDSVGKADAPLDNFLNLCVPKIGIISKELYMSTLGWGIERSTSTGAMLSMFRYMEPEVSDEVSSSHLSVDDIIEYCRQVGFYHASHAMPSDGQGLMKFSINYQDAFKKDPVGVAAQLLALSPICEFFATSTTVDAKDTPEASTRSSSAGSFEAISYGTVISQLTTTSSAMMMQTLDNIPWNDLVFDSNFDEPSSTTYTYASKITPQLTTQQLDQVFERQVEKGFDQDAAQYSKTTNECQEAETANPVFTQPMVRNSEQKTPASVQQCPERDEPLGAFFSTSDLSYMVDPEVMENNWTTTDLTSFGSEFIDPFAWYGDPGLDPYGVPYAKPREYDFHNSY